MQLIIILVIIYLIIKYIKKENGEDIEIDENTKSPKSNLKKIFSGILLFIPLFYLYYFIIAMISLLIINVLTNAADGAWGYALILGFSISPILTIITIIKILNKRG